MPVERFAEGIAVPRDAYPAVPAEIPAFVAALGLPGIVDIHTHAMPDRLQQAVWRYFDSLTDPPWPVRYRGSLEERLTQLREAGVLAHSALAYAHKPGMLGWLNGFTLDLADAHPQVIPTFTVFPEDGVTAAVADAVGRGGVVCKVHDQLSRFRLDDPRLDDAWRLVAEAKVLVVAHTSAVYGVDGGHETTGGDQVFAVKERHPDLRLCLAHLGMPDPDGRQWDAVEQLDGVWADTSMMLCDPVPMQMPGVRVDLAGLRERLLPYLLHGSDFPTIPHDLSAQLRGLAQLRLDPAGLRAVLHDRAVTLLADAGWTAPS